MCSTSHPDDNCTENRSLFVMLLPWVPHGPFKLENYLSCCCPRGLVDCLNWTSKSIVGIRLGNYPSNHILLFFLPRRGVLQ
uniref:Uncharacterized protein n=1 Tax=Romanomermis culicivorax TaxID=13658 RepID=A0A915JFQ3_ROMCU